MKLETTSAGSFEAEAQMELGTTSACAFEAEP
jgi:hypothetical protein